MMKNLLTITLILMLSNVLISQQLTADDRVTITQNSKAYIGVYAFGYQGLPTPGYPQFQLNNYGGVPGTPAATADNSILGMFAFSGHNGSAKKTVGVVRVKSMDNFASELSSRMDFLLGPSREQRMTILGESGRVGVNTEDPEAQMHVVNSDGTGIAAIYGESTYVGNASKVGIRGKSNNNPGVGIGGSFEGGSQGVFAFALGDDSAYTSHGVYGYAAGTAGTRTGVQGQGYNPGGDEAYGIYGVTTGAATTNYGVYGTASGATTNWAGYFEGDTYVDENLSVNEDLSVTGKLFVNYTGSTVARMVAADNSPYSVLELRNPGTASVTQGVGMDIHAGRIGIDVEVNENNFIGSHYGYFISTTTNGLNLQGSHYGLYSFADGSRATGFGNYAVYGHSGEISGAGTNWAGYFSGDVRITGALDNVSDVKLKRDVEDMDNALNIIKQLNPKTYHFRTDEFPHMSLDDRPQLGFIAQDVEKVLPQLVRRAHHPEFVNQEGEDSSIPNSPAVDIKSINYIGIIPVLTQGIKELTRTVEEKEAVIENLKTEVETVTKDNAELKSELADIKKQMTDVATMMDNKFRQMEKDMSSCCFNETNDRTGSINTNVELNGADVASLEQNSPNPFNEQTIIKYYIPSFAQKAAMIITDMKGSPLKSVNLEETGLGTVTINANELPVGTYIYTLYVDGRQIESKQMVLIK